MQGGFHGRKSAAMKVLPEKIQEAGTGKILFRWMDAAFFADDAWSTTTLSEPYGRK